MSTHLDARLASLGWDSWFEQRFESFAAEGMQPARVAADFGAEYLVHGAAETGRAVVGRRLRADAVTMPAAGDWVAVVPRAWDTPAVIHGIVERRTSFSRKVVHRETREQVLAANVDVSFIVVSAQDVNVRRIERYLAMAWQSGAVPAVVLTKADLLDSVDDVRLEIESVAAGTPVLATSSVTGEGVAAVAAQIAGARTGVLLGPSGAGKSSLINRMAGDEIMPTREVHSSGEGRHMTSHRELIELPDGGLIIDTPGLREAQLWAGEGALEGLFEDIEALELQCRFPDCEHRTEPGCAIKAALGDGSLDAGRLSSYRKLQRELRSVAARSDARLRADERRKWKQITINNRARERYLRR